MNDVGVSTYLLLVDPQTHAVLWANENVIEAYFSRTGATAVGQKVEDVIYLGKEVGVIDRLNTVAETGEPSHINTRTFSAVGEGSRTNGSVYQLPSGEILIASEWIPDKTAR